MERIEELEGRVEQLERDLILSKQHMTQTVQLMGEMFSKELDQVMDKYQQRIIEASVQVIKDKTL